MTDARWMEVDDDVGRAVEHFASAVALFRRGGFEAAGLDGYAARMALMHAMQSGHTSLEQALVRIMEILGEERPTGERWHADLIARASRSVPARRPEILDDRLSRAADETRRFRHVVVRNYDDFEPADAARAIGAAEAIADGIELAIARLRRAIDPA